MINKKKSLKVYLIATEPSGDSIGSYLIKTLKKEKKINVKLYGVGGSKFLRLFQKFLKYFL